MNQETKAPSPKQIDTLIEEYAQLQKAQMELKATSATLQEELDERKAKLLDVIEKHGFDHTDKSRRIEGLHHKATATTGTMVQVDDEACDTFRGFLSEKLPAGTIERFFSQRITYQLVKGPDDVLRTLDLPTRLRAKMTDLVRACFRVTTKAPSLKVDMADVR